MKTFVIVDIITLCISIYVALYSFRNITKSNRYTYHLLYFIFYILPLVIDYTFQIPNYPFLGFDISANDPITRIVYDLGLIVGQYIILNFKKKTDIRSNNLVIEDNSYSRILTILMLLPTIVCIVLVRNPALPFIFQWREMHLFSADAPFYYVAERLSYIGIASTLLLLFSTGKDKKNVFKRLIYILFVYMNVCTQGKRAALFFAIIVLVLILFLKYKQYLILRDRKFYSTKNLLMASLFAGFSLFAINVLYSVSVDVQLNRLTTGDEDMALTYTRIDFFRDDRVRLAIYSEQHPETVKILDNYCQTVFNDLRNEFVCFWASIPLRISKEPFIYQHYFSRGTLAENMVSQENCFMTVTYYAELISNFGIIIGMILFPLLCVWFSKLTDKFPYPMNLMIMTSFVLLNMFDVSYIMWYMEVFAIICYKYYQRTKQQYNG